MTLLYYAYILHAQVVVRILLHYCCCAVKYISCRSKIFVIISCLNIAFNKILIAFNTAILLYSGRCSFYLEVDRTKLLSFLILHVILCACLLNYITWMCEMSLP